MRTTLCSTLLVTTLTLAPLGAWQTPTPQSAAGADALAADIAKDWEAQKARMVAVAEAMPAEKYTFKTTPEQRTFGNQLLHLAQAHVRMLKPLDPAGKVPEPTIPTSETREDVIKSLTAAYDYGTAVLKAVDGPLHQTVGASTRARAFYNAMNNAMNHYGQCVVYLRVNGIVPPASRK
jgi:uncharacterized damage-inducible protein DinB